MKGALCCAFLGADMAASWLFSVVNILKVGPRRSNYVFESVCVIS